MFEKAEAELTDKDLKEELFEKQVFELFKMKWRTTFEGDYTKLQQVHSTAMDKKHLMNPAFEGIMLYGDHLFRYAHWDDEASETLLEPAIRKQMKDYAANGGLCIYISIVIYCMLHQEGFTEEQLRYWQGYYDAAVNQPFYEKLTDLERTKGLHAFLTLEDSIIDLTLGQLESLFVFQKHYFVLGDPIEGIDHYGYCEPHATVKAYARSFAKELGMTYYEWILMHKKSMLRVLQDSISK